MKAVCWIFLLFATLARAEESADFAAVHKAVATFNHPSDVAFVDATASQFGSVILKRSGPAMFVLKREGGVWRISVLRFGGWNR